MLILIAFPGSRPVSAALVNWLPWSVLKISGRPCRASASSSASRQRCDRSMPHRVRSQRLRRLMCSKWLQATVTRPPPALPQHGVCSARSNWESLSCSPSSGAARLRSCRYAANLAGLARDRPESARSGRSNSRLDQTNEHLSEGINVCRPQCVRLIHDTPSEGETINASHKAILTVPSRQGTWPTSRYPKNTPLHFIRWAVQ